MGSRPIQDLGGRRGYGWLAATVLLLGVAAVLATVGATQLAAPVSSEHPYHVATFPQTVGPEAITTDGPQVEFVSPGYGSDLIWASSDGGVSWSEVATVPGAPLVEQFVLARGPLLVLAVEESIFGASNTGLMVSNNSGASWTTSLLLNGTTQTPSPGSFVAVWHDDVAVVYEQGESGEGGICGGSTTDTYARVSTDLGLTWGPAQNLTLPSMGGYGFANVVAGPTGFIALTGPNYYTPTATCAGGAQEVYFSEPSISPSFTAAYNVSAVKPELGGNYSVGAFAENGTGILDLGPAAPSFVNVPDFGGPPANCLEPCGPPGWSIAGSGRTGLYLAVSEEASPIVDAYSIAAGATTASEISSVPVNVTAPVEGVLPSYVDSLVALNLSWVAFAPNLGGWQCDAPTGCPPPTVEHIQAFAYPYGSPQPTRPAWPWVAVGGSVGLSVASATVVVLHRRQSSRHDEVTPSGVPSP